MRIVTVNTSDQGGGAETRAWSLFKGFERRGAESLMVVGQKKSSDDGVMTFHESPYIDYRLYGLPPYQFLLQWRKRRSAELGLEDFDFPTSRRLLRITGRKPDIVHCQNLHGGFFDLRSLATISRKVPTFLTLHDSWTFTGHCAQPLDCERWRTGCGSCPYLSTPPAVTRDNTRRNWLRKQRIYSKSRLHVAAPSHWLLERARKSILAPAIVDSRVITPGINLDVFKPGSKSDARRELGISADAAVLVFVANHGRKNAFKDFATMQSAMFRLADEPGTQPIHLLCIGEAGPDEHRGRLLIRHIPYTPFPDFLARHYRAADVYLHAARSEAFGLTIAEAMACGTPVVASNVGGIPEVLVHQRHGYCVPQGDAVQMADAVSKLLDEPRLREQFGRDAAEHARARYDQERMIDAYFDWFLEHVSERGRTNRP
jgi:glycosyltransferase involved in cell wall biosynthesis